MVQFGCNLVAVWQVLWFVVLVLCGQGPELYFLHWCHGEQFSCSLYICTRHFRTAWLCENVTANLMFKNCWWLNIFHSSPPDTPQLPAEGRVAVVGAVVGLKGTGVTGRASNEGSRRFYNHRGWLNGPRAFTLLILRHFNFKII